MTAPTTPIAIAQPRTWRRTLPVVALLAALLAAFCMPSSALAIVFGADTSWFSNPASSTYDLSTTRQMIGLQEIVNGVAVDSLGNHVAAHDFVGQTIRLAADVNFANGAGEQTVPIGGDGSGHVFDGAFSGNGHKVYGYGITSYEATGVGLFGATGPDSSIRDVLVDHASVAISVPSTSGMVIADVGSLVGDCAGSMSGCTATVDVSVLVTSAVSVDASAPANIVHVGGLAGSVAKDLKQCRFAGTVSASSPSDAYEDDNRVIDGVGGIAGGAGGDAPGTGAHGDIAGCVNDGTIRVSTDGSGGVDRFGEAVISQSANVGGIAGHAIGNVTGCVNNSSIGATNTAGLGGIIGTLRTTAIAGISDEGSDPGAQTDSISIGDCSNLGALTGRFAVGGIVGSAGSYTTITRCTNARDAHIAASRWNKPAGAGIAGQTFGCVSDCYNRGDVQTLTGGGFYMAGIVGMVLRHTDKNNNFTSPQSEVRSCYNVGTIVASGNFKQGSLVGQNDGYVHDCCFVDDSVLSKGVSGALSSAIGDTDMVGSVNNLSMLTRAQMTDGTATAKLNALAPAEGWKDYFLNLPSCNDGYPEIQQRVPSHVATSLAGASVQLTENAKFSATFDPVPTLHVTLGDQELKQGADFRVMAQPGASAVTSPGVTPYHASIVGMGAYSGTVADAAPYGIDQGDFSTCVVTAESRVFNWEAQVPASVTVRDAAGNVVDPSDYTYEVYGLSLVTHQYEAGVACMDKRLYGYPVVAKAKDGTNYQGSTIPYLDPNSLSKNAFIIKWADLVSDCTIEGFEIDGQFHAWHSDKDINKSGFIDPVKVTYTGHQITPAVVGLRYLGHELSLRTDQNPGDFTYVYGVPADLTNMSTGKDTNTNVSSVNASGCVTVRYRPGGNFTNWVNAFFDIVPAQIASATLSEVPRKYTGSPITIPRPTFNGTTLAEGADYTVAYSNNVAVGTATYVVTGKGNFTGTYSGSFAILPLDTVSTAVTVSGASSVKRAHTYKVSGRVTPAAVSGRVKLVFMRYYKSKWRQVGSTKYATLSKGAYTYKYAPPTRGSWRVYATYLGNAGSIPVYRASATKYVGFKTK